MHRLMLRTEMTGWSFMSFLLHQSLIKHNYLFLLLYMSRRVHHLQYVYKTLKRHYIYRAIIMTCIQLIKLLMVFLLANYWSIRVRLGFIRIYFFIIIFNTVAIVRANSHPLLTTKILVYLPLMAFMPEN